ncbi:MAG TPA: winged helix-turn-helix domain-containing protein [Candidatus Nitrosotenuis sp.]|nr:winged helix-turn-helix domain-containing protein [Candidatus Nitrosotenuis sp.]
MTPRFLKNKSEDLRIYFSDDDKIKSFGEVLTSDSGRLILKILLSESLTANQLAQKTSISLQLVKYHIDKMQGLGIVNVSKIEKNSKSHDMKYYVARKFAIMILPQTELDKIKQKILDSATSVSKMTLVGISVVSAWLMTQLIQPSSQNSLVEQIKSKISYAGIKSLPGTIDETLELARAKVSIASSEAALGSGTPIYTQELFVIHMAIIGTIMAFLAGFFFWKARDGKKQDFDSPKVRSSSVNL